MGPSFIYFLGHCICTIIFSLLASAWKMAQRWVFLFSFLFFICSPAVFLIWGPWRFYGLYASAFIIFLLLARGTDRFYVFLKGQETVARLLFWAAVAVFCGAVIATSVSEIILRRDALTFWAYESKRHPTPEAMNNLADAYYGTKNFVQAREFYQKAIHINPNFIEAYEGLARLAEESDAWDLSVAYYQKLLL